MHLVFISFSMILALITLDEIDSEYSRIVDALFVLHIVET